MTRWGVLGCATIARHHMIPAIQHSGDEVVAIASRSLDRVEHIAEQLGIATAHHGYDALLADESVDVVYIPLPNSLHHEWARRALSAGKHVLLEKPAVIRTAHARDLADLARERDLVLAEAFMYRWHPQWEVVRELLDRELAPDASVTLRVHIGMALDDDSDIRQSAALHGGALRDLGCYAVDVASWLFGAAEQAGLRQFTDYHEVDQLSAGWLSFPRGRVAVFDCDFRHSWVNTPVEIRTRALTLVLEHAFNPLEYPVQVRVLRPDVVEEIVDVPGTNAHHEMVRDFSTHCGAGSDTDWARARREALTTTAANLELLRTSATTT